MDPEILILEEEGALARTLLRIRNSLNLTVHVATNALHAISLLQRHSYIALIIDEEVGYVDGWALLRYLEENRLSLDTIVVPAAGVPAGFDREFTTALRVPLGELPEAITECIRRTRSGPDPTPEF